MSIGELARAAQVSQRTIRYYEELGILPAPPRSAGGTRRYPTEFRRYLEGALVLKQLGFRLEEIAELGRWALGGSATSARAKAILADKVAEVERRMRVLHQLREAVATAASDDRDGTPPAPELLAWLGNEHAGLTRASDPPG